MLNRFLCFVLLLLTAGSAWASFSGGVTDRTGRGMNLEWDGTGPDARAYREWADDGSYDTKLEWDPNIRLTYVTDAEGGETWHYCDIKGYTYRILHPDKSEEFGIAKNAQREIAR
jgi:hypothetical protein